MLIDFHTHCFPEKIAEGAIKKLSCASGGLVNYTDGTVGGLKSSMKKHNVDFSVVLNIATNAHQQKSVNDFASSVNGKDGIISFGSVYPHSDDALEQLEYIKSLGLKGVKLHPDYQGFRVDDEKMKPIYRKISQLGLITVFHAGFDYGFPPPYGCMPKNLARALEWFDTPVVAAHWGGNSCGQEVLDCLCGKNVYFDTSFGYGNIPRYFAEKIIEKHSADKILFGTDTPWHTPEQELRLIGTLGLNQEEFDKITHKNAEALLGL